MHLKRHRAMDMRVARVLSQAPASCTLTRDGVEGLLRRHGGSVTQSVTELRRQAADDPSVVQPVPELGTPFRNLEHASNSCYVAATVVACFAQWDAWDALLSAPFGGDSAPTSALRASLREIVNKIRTDQAVSRREVDTFRDALVALGFHGGNRQEDATELFVRMVDWLGAPFLPFAINLKHGAMPDEGDERFVTERILWLPLPEGEENGNFANLLDEFFFGEMREGLRRTLPNREAIVNAWCVRLLLPEYTPSKGVEDTNVRNSFDTLAMPFAIKRYNAQSEKQRMPIEIPLKIDFTKYVNSSTTGEKYSLLLKSIICHIGPRIGYGHYVAYTYDRTAWRRWDDMRDGRVASECEDDDGLPLDPDWRSEILRDSYMVFYELLPGDGTGDPYEMLDAASSGDIGPGEYWQHVFRARQESLDFKVAQELQRTLELQRALELQRGGGGGGGGESDLWYAKKVQEKDDAAYARRKNNQINVDFERGLREKEDLEMARRMHQEDHLEQAAASSGSTASARNYHDASANSDGSGGNDVALACTCPAYVCHCENLAGYAS